MGMEQLFHATLIKRSRKVFRLTRQGKVVYKYSRTITDAYAAMYKQVRKIQPSRS